MKTQITILITLLLTIAAHASDNFFTMSSVGFTATATINNPNDATSGNVKTFPAPGKFKITTAILIGQLAFDEHSEGNWLSNSFPKGAKLVFMDDKDTPTNSYFIVTDSSGKQLLNVSDLISVTISTADVISTGQVNFGNDLDSNFVMTSAADFVFDDTKAGGSSHFDLKGVGADKTNDKIKGAILTRTESITINPTIGFGTLGGNATVLDGSVTLSGSETFPQ